LATFSITKDPQAVLDYQLNWSNWLTGDTIAASTITPAAGLTLDSEANTTTTQTAWLSGGAAGVTYDVVFEITTDGGRTDQRTLAVIVMER